MAADIKKLANTWDSLGEEDALWAVLSDSNLRGGKWDEKEFYASGVREITELMKYVDQQPWTVARDRALDFGCGVGRLTAPLGAYFKEAIGVDIAASMINLANKYKSRPNLTFVHNEVDDLSVFEDNYFDFIYTNIVLQHMRPVFMKTYLREFMRILNQGGVVIFQLPSERRVNSRTDVKPMVRNAMPASLAEWVETKKHLWRDKPFELHSIRRPQVEKLITENGGRVVEVDENNATGDTWRSYRYTVIKE